MLIHATNDNHSCGNDNGKRCTWVFGAVPTQALKQAAAPSFAFGEQGRTTIRNWILKGKCLWKAATPPLQPIIDAIFL